MSKREYTAIRVDEEDNEMRLKRQFAMPNASTFGIKPIRKLIEEEMGKYPSGVFCDPFVGKKNPFKTRVQLTNDQNPEIEAGAHKNAIDFLQQDVPTAGIDLMFFDPPYTVHQINEVYAGFGDGKAFKQITMFAIQMVRAVKPGGRVICFGYNSVGVPATLSRDEKGNKIKGKKRTGFRIERVMTVCHGASHNDTIVTVCVKDGPCDFHFE